MVSIKVDPNHNESEKALLGSMLLNPDVFYDIVDVIAKKSFYSPKHGLIYDSILQLHKDGEPIDMVTLAKKLELKNELSTIGGREYLAELIESVPSTLNAKFYANNVREYEARRSVIRAGREIEEIGYDQDSGKIEEIVDKAEKALYDATFDKSDKKYQKISQSLEEAVELLSSGKLETGRGVSSGYSSINNKIAGFQPSDLIILAARPSVGKTTLALDIARKVAIKDKVPVGIFSLEMSAVQLSERMLAAEAKVNAWKLRTKGIEGDNVVDALGRFNEAPIYVDDRPGMSILSIRSTARRLKKQHNIGIIIVDYLQLVTPYHTKSSDSLVQQITEISRTLKQIARELNIPVIALSQLSREVEKRDGMPRLSDLRDSGAIEQDADLVCFLHRNKQSFTNAVELNKSSYVVEFLIEKHRNGPTGKVDLLFNRETVSFDEIDKSHSNSESAS